MIEPQPAAGFVKTLPSLRHVAECAARRGSRVLFAQALLPQAFRLQPDVRFDLVAEVTRLAFAPEHGLASVKQEREISATLSANAARVVLPAYSNLNATNGSIRAARQAGT